MKLRLLPTDDEHRLRGDALEKAIELDRQQGLIPFFVSMIDSRPGKLTA